MATVTAVKAAIAQQVPALRWSQAQSDRRSCEPGPPPLDTVTNAYRSQYQAVGLGPIPAPAWPRVRAGGCRLPARHGFTTVTTDGGRPGARTLLVAGPYDAVLDVGDQEGTVVSLQDGETGSPCA